MSKRAHFSTCQNILVLLVCSCMCSCQCPPGTYRFHITCHGLLVASLMASCGLFSCPLQGPISQIESCYFMVRYVHLHDQDVWSLKFTYNSPNMSWTTCCKPDGFMWVVFMSHARANHAKDGFMLVHGKVCSFSLSKALVFKVYSPENNPCQSVDIYWSSYRTALEGICR